MNFEEHKIYHIYNRGNNRQKIFFQERNYDYFLSKIQKEFSPLAEILAYCLMPNHFHLMVFVKDSSTRRPQYSSDDLKSSDESITKKIEMHPIARKIAVILSSYTKAINIQENRTGSLFQQKTKSKCLNCEAGGLSYMLTCLHYIHQNPLKSGLVSRLEDWPYSSFNEYCTRNGQGFSNVNFLSENTNIDFSNFYNDSYEVINPDYLNRIW